MPQAKKSEDPKFNPDHNLKSEQEIKRPRQKA